MILLIFGGPENIGQQLIVNTVPCLQLTNYNQKLTCAFRFSDGDRNFPNHNVLNHSTVPHLAAHADSQTAQRQEQIPSMVSQLSQDFRDVRAHSVTIFIQSKPQ